MSRLNALLRRFGRPRLWSDFPPSDEIQSDRLAKRLQAPLPEREFVIFFTPRSGSSMLGDLARRTGVLGKPNELFNPNHMAKIARALDATSLISYCEVARRSQTRGGSFGFKITYPQLGAVFPNEAAFREAFPNPHVFWLIREDIVLQAVSLYKMQKTHLAHSPNTTAEERSTRESQVVYDGPEIRYWLQHILRAEEDTEALIKAGGFTPLRMSYERNIGLRPNQLANVMVRHVGLRTMRLPGIESAHVKIGTNLNTGFADRFRAEYADWLTQVEDARAPMLEKITYYGPRKTGAKTDATSRARRKARRGSKTSQTRGKRQ